MFRVYPMHHYSAGALFPISEFVLDEMFQQKRFKIFHILYTYKKTHSYFGLGFRIYKIWQILKRFAGTFRRAQTLKLEGVGDLFGFL